MKTYPPLSKGGFGRVREIIREAQERDNPYLVVEGDHLLAEAVDSELDPKIIVVCPSLWTGPTKKNIDALLNPGWDIHSLPAKDFSRLAPSSHPAGILAIVPRPPMLNLLDWSPKRNSLLAADIQDPGNLGTLIRIAEAFGAEAVLVTPNGASPANAKTVRASAGSLFRTPIGMVDNLTEFLRKWVQRGISVMAADPHRGRPAAEIDFSPPAILVIGAEGKGLPPEVNSLVNIRITIPLNPPVESLNAATAAAIILYELKKRLPTHP